jgi:hypothetical protein
MIRRIAPGIQCRTVGTAEEVAAATASLKG